MTDHHPSRQAFQQFQYLTVPLHVSDDYMNRALRKALPTVLDEDGEDD
jgi:hypothetical protein